MLFRQTNVVWLLFSFGTACVSDLTRSKTKHALHSGSILAQVQALTLALWKERQGLTSRLGPLLLPVLCFLVFVVLINDGSIVVGDHSNHQPSIHLAQLA